MAKYLSVLLLASLAIVCWAKDEGKVIAPDGQEAVAGEPGKLSERWGHGYHGHRHSYYYYPSYGYGGYYYPSYNRWYYRDGKPVPEDKAPPAPTSEPEDARVKRSAEKVIGPDGKEAVAGEPGKLSERWGHGYHGHRNSYYHYPSYGHAGYYYPSYNRWYYRDGKPVPEDKAPPAPTSEPEPLGKVKRSAEKVVGPDGKEAVAGEPGKLSERWGHGYHGHRNSYYYYPSYGYGGYYYPSYNRWYYRDGKPVPEDKAPPAPTSEPEDARVKRSAEKVVGPDGKEAVAGEPGKLSERWGHGYHGHRNSYYYYPSYGYGGYYYPSYNRWYYRDGKPVPEDKAPPAPTSEPEDARVKRSAEKVIGPDGKEAVAGEPGKLSERWGHGYHGHRNSYYHYPSYGHAGYYYPSYNRWYYRDGKPVPEDKAPPAPTSEPEPLGKVKRSAEKVIGPDGKEAVAGEPGKLSERWGHGYHGHRNSYYHYPSYGHAGYYYPSYNRWYYRDGKPVPEDKAPPAPTSEPEPLGKVKRSAEKVVGPDGKEAVAGEPGKLSERWGHGYGGYYNSYYYYPSYGYGGYYYPSYNRWYYRDGKPVPEDKAPPAPTSEPEDARVKRSAEKVVGPDGKEAVAGEPGKLSERWGHGYHGHRNSYYYYPSYGYGGYYYPSYNRWYYRDGKPVPEDKAPPAPTSEPEPLGKVKRSIPSFDIYGYPYPYQMNVYPVPVPY